MKTKQPTPAQVAWLDSIGVRVDGRNVWRVALPYMVVCVTYHGVGRMPWEAWQGAPRDLAESGWGANPRTALARYCERKGAALDRLSVDVRNLAGLIVGAR